MKKKVLIFALSLLASAGTIWSMETEQGEGNAEITTYVIFSTDKSGEQGDVREHMDTFLQGCIHKGSAVSRGNIIMMKDEEEEEDAVVGHVLWCREVSGVDKGEPLCGASDLFNEVGDSEGTVEEVLKYLKEGICIATPEEHQELEEYKTISLELFKKLYQLHDHTLIGLQVDEESICME